MPNRNKKSSPAKFFGSMGSRAKDNEKAGMTGGRRVSQERIDKIKARQKEKAERLGRRDQRIAARKGITEDEATKFREARHARNIANIGRGLAELSSSQKNVDSAEFDKKMADQNFAQTVKDIKSNYDFTPSAGGGVNFTNTEEPDSTPLSYMMKKHMKKKGY